MQLARTLRVCVCLVSVRIGYAHWPRIYSSRVGKEAQEEEDEEEEEVEKMKRIRKRIVEDDDE